MIRSLLNESHFVTSDVPFIYFILRECNGSLILNIIWIRYERFNLQFSLKFISIFESVWKLNGLFIVFEGSNSIANKPNDFTHYAYWKKNEIKKNGDAVGLTSMLIWNISKPYESNTTNKSKKGAPKNNINGIRKRTGSVGKNILPEYTENWEYWM